MNVRPYGWDSLLLEVDDPAGWLRALQVERARGTLVCDEIVPAAQTVLLRGVVTAPDFSRIEPMRPRAGAAEAEIAVRWDGADLGDVARLWGRDPVRVMRDTRFTVAFCGFAPGFAYLSGLPLPAPRLGTPRIKVPAGAVAVAGRYAGVYPRSSPGGWRLLGSTDAVLFDLDREPPALLQPGMSVRFVDA